MLALPSISVSTLSISLASQESKADHLSVMPVCGRLKIQGSFLRAFKLLPGKAAGAISLVCCTLFPFVSGVRNPHPNRGIRRNLLTSPIPQEFPECFHCLPEKTFFRPGKQSAHRGDFPLEQGPCRGRAAGDQCLSVRSQTVTTATSLTVIPMVAFVGGWVLLWRQQVGRVGDTSLAWELAPHHLVSCSASHSAFTGTIYSKHWPSVSQKPTARTSPHIPALCKRFSPHNPQRRLSSIGKSRPLQCRL